MPTTTSKNFVVFKSSAGSGKTYTLVKEYLKLVISNPERYSKILAITFTNKAANEMKERIVRSLKELSSFYTEQPDDKIISLMTTLEEELGFDARKISSRATVALSLILHNYSRFAVSTIDSFVHKLVRVFSRDLGLPAAFDVELETEKLIAKTVDLLISKAGVYKDLTKILISFISSKMEDEKNWNIKKELKDFTQNIIEERTYEALKNISKLSPSDFLEISHKLLKIKNDFENRIKKTAQRASNLIDKKGIDLKAFSHGLKGIGNYFKKIAEGNFSTIKPNSYIQKTINEDKWTSASCSAADKNSIATIKDELITDYNEIQNILEKDYDEYLLSQLVGRNIYLMAILSEIEKVMEEFRQNENIVHISEFNKRIAAIVQREAIPYIYERIGERYRHFLIDEFQDTSLLQWQNMIPLLENSLSANNFNMIVGDGKQAIYRWRNGEVEQFAALPQLYKRGNDETSITREKLFVSQSRLKNLDKNFRSAIEIIRFNNAFFEFAKSKIAPDLQRIYDGLEQEGNLNKSGGYLQFEFLKDNVDDNNDEVGELVREKRVFEILKELEDTNLFARQEIAILVRKNKQAIKVANYLLQQGITVVSSEALLLGSSPKVRVLMALLEFFIEQENRQVITEILFYFFKRGKFGEASFHKALAQCKEISPDEPASISMNETLKGFGLDLTQPHMHTLSLTDIFEFFIMALQPDIGDNDPFVTFFLDMVYEQSQKQPMSYQDFLDFWNDTGCKKSIIIPEDTPSVRVMTIHKAKGLQFKVVICPYMFENVRNSQNSAWIEPGFKSIPELKFSRIPLISALKDTSYQELYQRESDKSFLDMLNLLYVAFTRPEKRLYVISKDKRKDNQKWSFATPQPDMSDILFEFLNENNIPKDENERFVIGEKISLSKPGNKFDISTEKAYNNNARNSDAKITSANWRYKIKIRQRANQFWTESFVDKQRDFGLLLHRIMARISTLEDLDPVLKDLQNNGTVQPEQVPDLKSEIQKVISRPEINKYFQKGVKAYNEKDILLNDSTVLRPDRVVIDGNKVIVIDYKTGKKDAKHKQQMTEYIEALRQMGHLHSEYHLVYLNP